ncbi:Leukotoxin [Pseudovibrio sp. W64]|nr:Leukotoxin [Pseudovibrio sp. W64]
MIETFGAASLEIIGNDAAETLVGGDGADIINGNGGNDLITGGAGDDQLNGGEGSDIFVFAAGDTGHDVLTDFDATDVIQVEAALFVDFIAIMDAAEMSDSNTVITIDTDTSITLQGVTPAELQPDDFLFI